MAPFLQLVEARHQFGFDKLSRRSYRIILLTFISQLEDQHPNWALAGLLYQREPFGRDFNRWLLSRHLSNPTKNHISFIVHSVRKASQPSPQDQ